MEESQIKYGVDIASTDLHWQDEIADKDARNKELEEMIRQLGSLAFMGDMPLDQIVAHFIAWGQSNYDYTSRLEAAFLEAEEQRLAFCKNFNHDPKDRWVVVDMDGERMEAEAREALESIKAETGSGDHVAGANKLILTAEQREEEGKRDA